MATGLTTPDNQREALRRPGDRRAVAGRGPDRRARRVPHHADLAVGLDPAQPHQQLRHAGPGADQPAERPARVPGRRRLRRDARAGATRIDILRGCWPRALPPRHHDHLDRRLGRARERPLRHPLDGRVGRGRDPVAGRGRLPGGVVAAQLPGDQAVTPPHPGRGPWHPGRGDGAAPPPPAPVPATVPGGHRPPATPGPPLLPAPTASPHRGRRHPRPHVSRAPTASPRRGRRPHLPGSPPARPGPPPPPPAAPPDRRVPEPTPPPPAHSPGGGDDGAHAAPRLSPAAPRLRCGPVG